MVVRCCGGERRIIETALAITFPTRVGHIEDLENGSLQTAPDRVASGRYRPEAPTDPYVLALEHTVLQIMSLLRV